LRQALSNRDVTEYTFHHAAQQDLASVKRHATAHSKAHIYSAECALLAYLACVIVSILALRPRKRGRDGPCCTPPRRPIWACLRLLGLMRPALDAFFEDRVPADIILAAIHRHRIVSAALPPLDVQLLVGAF